MDATLKVILVGENGSGKTSVRPEYPHSDQMAQTIGYGFLNASLSHNGKEVGLQIWDTAGSEKYRALTPMYFRDASIIILVYSVKNRRTFNVVGDLFQMIKDMNEPDSIVVLVANHTQEEGERVISTQEGRALARSLGVQYFEVDEKTHDGIDQLYNEAVGIYFSRQHTK